MKKYSTIEEIKPVVEEIEGVKEIKADSFIWKWDKLLYRLERVRITHKELQEKEEEFKSSEWKKIKNDLKKRGIGNWLVITYEKNWDKNFLFEFEAFLDESIEVLDVLPSFFSSKYLDIKTASFYKFKKSLVKRYPKEEITRLIKGSWDRWIEDLKEWRDTETHHSVHYHRHEIKIRGTDLTFLSPALPNHPIRNYQTNMIEDHQYEFKEKANIEDWERKLDEDEFWDAFNDYYRRIEEYCESTVRNIDDLFNDLLSKL